MTPLDDEVVAHARRFVRPVEVRDDPADWFTLGEPAERRLGEFDALPMISQKGRVAKKDPIVEGAPGHGCGHNAMCTAAAAAAIAVKETMVAHGLKGTIKVFGSPAEETLISRPYMVRAGLFTKLLRSWRRYGRLRTCHT